MRYWVLRSDGQGADGPFEASQLKSVPGFGPDRIIAPEDAQSAAAWKPAKTFDELRVLFVKPPPPPMPATPPRPAPPPPPPPPQDRVPLPRPARSVPKQVPAQAVQASPKIPPTTTWSPTVSSLLTIGGVILACLIFAMSMRTPKPQTEDSATRPTPAGAAAPAADPWQGREQEAIDFVKRFPTRSRGARFPLSIADVIQRRSYMPETVGQSVEGLMFFNLASRLEQSGCCSALKSEEAEAKAEEMFNQEVTPRWSATRIAGPLYKVTYSTRFPFKPRAVTNPKPFEVNLEQKTLKPLTALCWMALDVGAVGRWINTTGNQHESTDIDDIDVSAVAPAYELAAPAEAPEGVATPRNSPSADHRRPQRRSVRPKPDVANLPGVHATPRAGTPRVRAEPPDASADTLKALLECWGAQQLILDAARKGMSQERLDYATSKASDMCGDMGQKLTAYLDSSGDQDLSRLQAACNRRYDPRLCVGAFTWVQSQR